MRWHEVHHVHTVIKILDSRVPIIEDYMLEDILISSMRTANAILCDTLLKKKSAALAYQGVLCKDWKSQGHLSRSVYIDGWSSSHFDLLVEW